MRIEISREHIILIFNPNDYNKYVDKEIMLTYDEELKRYFYGSENIKLPLIIIEMFPKEDRIYGYITHKYIGEKGITRNPISSFKIFAYADEEETLEGLEEICSQITKLYEEIDAKKLSKDIVELVNAWKKIRDELPTTPTEETPV